MRPTGWATDNPKIYASELAHIQAGGLVDLGATGRPVAKRPLLVDPAAIFKSRMLVGVFLAQYCIASIT